MNERRKSREKISNENPCNKSAKIWSVSDVNCWLDHNGFGEYCQSFILQKIDGEVLLMLTEQDLKKDLQVKILGDLKKLITAITRLKFQHNCEETDIPVHTPLISTDSPCCSNTTHHLQHGQKSGPSPQNARNRTYSFDSQTSERNEQQQMGSESHRSYGVASSLKPEYTKTIISALYMLSVTWITAIVMVFVHDRVPDRERHPPLPDIFLDNVPHISWAFQLCEVTILVQTTTLAIILFFHKHRSIALRRFAALSGSVFLLRCSTMFITSLSVPGHHLECTPRDPSDFQTKLSQAWIIWQGGGLSIKGVRTCGDYMFSGHTTALTMLNFFITEYTPRRVYYLHIASWVLNTFGIFFILAAHEHYSIDVFIAFYITSRMFMYYHSLANNRALHQTDSFRTKIWFPMFSYFEANIDGLVPNEYSNPLCKDNMKWVWRLIYDFSNKLYNICSKFIQVDLKNKNK